jgi:uncharacterized coiled-coil protein SlyX
MKIRNGSTMVVVACVLGFAGPAAAQSVEERLDELEALTALQGRDISTLKAQVAALQAENAAQAAAITALQAARDSLWTAVWDVTDHADEIEDALADHVFIDDARHAPLASTVSTHTTQISGLTTHVNAIATQVTSHGTRLGAYDVLWSGVTRASRDLFFTGVNLHIRNGSSPGGTATQNGAGNLIIGYNEPSTEFASSRDGSHNLVIGPGHEYGSYGGLVAGANNRLDGPSASITGGSNNYTFGAASHVSGGFENQAVGIYSSVSGGYSNLVGDTAWYGSVTGGRNNSALGSFSSVSGGLNRNVYSLYDWRAGGLLQSD